MTIINTQPYSTGIRSKEELMEYVREIASGGGMDILGTIKTINNCIPKQYIIASTGIIDAGNGSKYEIITVKYKKKIYKFTGVSSMGSIEEILYFTPKGNDISSIYSV